MSQHALFRPEDTRFQVDRDRLLAELRGLLQDAGFEVMDSTRGREAGMTGVPEDWVTVLSRAA